MRPANEMRPSVRAFCTPTPSSPRKAATSWARAASRASLASQASQASQPSAEAHRYCAAVAVAGVHLDHLRDLSCRRAHASRHMLHRALMSLRLAAGLSKTRWAPYNSRSLPLAAARRPRSALPSQCLAIIRPGIASPSRIRDTGTHVRSRCQARDRLGHLATPRRIVVQSAAGRRGPAIDCVGGATTSPAPANSKTSSRASLSPC